MVMMARWKKFMPHSELAFLLDHYKGSFSHITQTHAFMVSRGLDQDNTLLSKLIDTTTSLGFSDYAYSIFQHKKDANIYLWNTMIKGLSSIPHSPEAISLYNTIQNVGLRPDSYSIPFVLKACAHLSTTTTTMAIHAQAVRIGLCQDVHVQTAFIQTYAACGYLSCSRQIFDQMPSRDLISWNAILAAYVKFGDIKTACKLFDEMPHKDVISWTALIAGYAQINQPNEAIILFRRMQFVDIEPDEITILSVLSACAQVGALELGEWIHAYIDRHNLYKIVPLTNALIDMYVKSGRIDKALEVFNGMIHKSVITWSTIIAGLAFHGLGMEALKMFSRMEGAEVMPNGITFIAILSACSHIGFVKVGRCFFDKMRTKYSITPTIEHYGCMVDLLGRAGYLCEAFQLISEMPFIANGAIWGALLSAARIHVDVKLGELALQHLTEVEPHNSGNYILLSNIYASLGRWDDVRNLRKLMRDKGVKKAPGGSYVEVGNSVHEFVAGDNSHPHAERIYEIASEIDLQLRMAGYVPNTCILLDFDEV
ncbi:Pentatricopeptide repeat-containing protein [Nymphaea thermarum]|nr:Pentatricopeptide repeat-containing protein [Nymphaea thermarum]